MTISTFDQYVDAKFNRSSAYLSQYSIANIIPAAAGIYSFWQKNIAPANGASPSGVTGDALTNATTGAIPLPSVPGGNTLYTDAATLAATTSLTGWVADRLVHTNGLSGTVTTAQSVNSVALPARATGGVGTMLALEAYTATGASSVTFTVSYTNSSGTAGRTGIATGTLNQIGKILFVQLDVGDVGVQSVQSVQSPTTGTTGNYGITIYKPAIWINAGSSPGAGAYNSVFDMSLSPVSTAACLWLYAHNPTAIAVSTFQFGLGMLNGLWTRISLVICLLLTK